MTDLEDVFHYLRIQVDHDVSEKITFCQSIYLKKELDCFKMTDCKPAFIPMDPGVENFLLPYNGNVNKEITK